MQTTNGTSTVQLNEQKILDLIIDPRLEKLERVFKKHYNCKSITDLTPEQTGVFLYLCIVALNMKASELSDVYNISLHKIVTSTKVVFKKSHTNKKYHNFIYNLYITYRQSITRKPLTKSVA